MNKLVSFVTKPVTLPIIKKSVPAWTLVAAAVGALVVTAIVVNQLRK